MDESEKRRTWALYLTTIIGWQMHPGHKLTPNQIAGGIPYAAALADAMLKQTEERWPTGEQ